MNWGWIVTTAIGAVGAIAGYLTQDASFQHNYPVASEWAGRVAGILSMLLGASHSGQINLSPYSMKDVGKLLVWFSLVGYGGYQILHFLY